MTVMSLSRPHDFYLTRIRERHVDSQISPEQIIREAAAEWAVRLHAGPLASAEVLELLRWRAADPRHEAALAFARSTWAALGELGADADGQVASAARRARSPVARAVRPRRARRLWQRAASAALLVLVIGAGGLNGPELLLRLQADYLAGKGEVRQVQLADGSTVELDSGSAISLAFTNSERRIRLLSGSACFDVAPMGEGENRPFVVESAGGQTRALGTRFVVGRESAEQAWVGVLQHSVAVSLQAAPLRGKSEQQLDEGQGARYSKTGGVQALNDLNLQRATGWRRGVLVFERQPLAQVVEQLNRYRKGRIVLGDSTLGERQISGVFRLDMLDSVAATLSQELQLKHFDLAGLSLIY